MTTRRYRAVVVAKPAELGRPELVANLEAPHVTPKPIAVVSPDEVVKLFDGFHRTVA